MLEGNTQGPAIPNLRALAPRVDLQSLRYQTRHVERPPWYKMQDRNIKEYKSNYSTAKNHFNTTSRTAILTHEFINYVYQNAFKAIKEHSKSSNIFFAEQLISATLQLISFCCCQIAFQSLYAITNCPRFKRIIV